MDGSTSSVKFSCLLKAFRFELGLQGGKKPVRSVLLGKVLKA